MWIPDHRALDVETAIANEDDSVAWLGITYVWRSTPKYFTLRSRFTLWKEDVSESFMFFKEGFGHEERVVELDNAHESERFVFIVLKVARDRFNKQLDIKLDLHEDVQKVSDNHLLD